MTTTVKVAGRVTRAWTAALLVAVGCSGAGNAGREGVTASGGNTGAGTGGAANGGGSPFPVPVPVDGSLADYTLSYRSAVRLPPSGEVMAFDAFADQVERLDPITAKRCPVSHAAAFHAAADALGGISWTHPVEILKDRSKPPLQRGKRPTNVTLPPTTGDAGGDRAATAAPTIERPDLVGYQESTAIFLSQRHGLLAVKTDTARPVLSCSLKLPGTARYFFYHDKEIVLLVNGLGSRVSQAALLRFGVTATGFDFIDAVMLDRQQILDARLFDRTLVVYATLFGPPPATTTPPPPTGDPSTTGSTGGAPTADPSRSAPVTPSAGPNIGVKMTAVKWGAAPLAVAWQEEFLNDPASAPLAGQNPVEAAKQLVVGDVVSTARNYKPFISASDRYVVMSRDVNKTIFNGTKSQTYTYCVASHPGPDRSATYCAPKYEQRKNPDYKDPQSTNGDYPCRGQTLLACIQEAAPTVSRYIYVRVGETCTTYTYHDFICDRSETQTVSYPTYRTERSTQFVVYRYVDGDFVKLDQQLYQLASPGTTTGTVPSLTFTGQPLEVRGAIDHKGDLQFQQGHFYVLTDQGQHLHTLLLAGNSIAELGLKEVPRQGAYSYSAAHSTLFSDARMMVSRAYNDPARPQGISSWSDVIMLDLTTPSFPASLNQFLMPGASTQLILAKAGVLGPGSVSFTSGGVARNLQKISLFNQNDASELDNILLGTEFNANFMSTWLGTADDQRIRLDDGTQRLFLPYGGYHHVPQEVFNPVAHRLNITAVGAGLTSEVTFDLVEDIIRTVSLDSSSPTTSRALAFGDSSVYALNQGANGWSLDVIEEFATPLAVYRLRDDGDIHARIDRIGARCQISTFRGSAHAFAPQRLAAGPQVDCTEQGSPMAVGSAVVFPQSATGWRLSADGLTMTALTVAEVAEALTHVRNDVYCALDGTKIDSTPVPYLDEVPAKVDCFAQADGAPVDPPGSPPRP